MTIISTNISNPKTISWRGKEVQTGIFKEPVAEGILLQSEDVQGDHVIDRRFHGGKDKACYVYSADHYAYWKTKYASLKWTYGMFGENITATGLNEENIYIGDVFKVGQAVVQVSQPRQPCFKLGIRFNDPGMVKAFINANFPGFYLRVIESGIAKVGDSFDKLSEGDKRLSVVDIFRLLYHPRTSDEVSLALSSKFLPDSTKADIRKKQQYLS